MTPMNEITTYRTVDVSYARERFGPDAPDWEHTHWLINEHLCEVRGIQGDIALDRYLQMQTDGRLVWMVARHKDCVIGFSCHYWYRDLNFPFCVAQDGLWHVASIYRNLGIGRKLKEMGHDELRRAGVKYTTDILRKAFTEDKLMLDMGYHRWGQVWRKGL
jgi:hypothetical protein